MLPVIDLNELKNSEYSSTVIVNEKKELVNNTALDIATQIIAAIKSERLDPIEFAVKKKLLIDALDIAMKDKDVNKMMRDSIEQHGKEGAKALGATVNLVDRAKYDYSKDEMWLALTETIAETVAKIKLQEDKIKVAVKNNAALVDSDTGEVIASVVPAPVTTSITVSFKK